MGIGDSLDLFLDLILPVGVAGHDVQHGAGQDPSISASDEQHANTVCYDEVLTIAMVDEKF